MNNKKKGGPDTTYRTLETTRVSCEHSLCALWQEVLCGRAAPPEGPLTSRPFINHLTHSSTHSSNSFIHSITPSHSSCIRCLPSSSSPSQHSSPCPHEAVLPRASDCAHSCSNTASRLERHPSSFFGATALLNRLLPHNIPQLASHQCKLPPSDKLRLYLKTRHPVSTALEACVTTPRSRAAHIRTASHHYMTRLLACSALQVGYSAPNTRSS